EALAVHVYGRGLEQQPRRSTAKRAPYLRLASPSPVRARRAAPRVVETVRGTKIRSARTQTSPPGTVPSGPTQYLFSPSRALRPSSGITGPTEGHLIPMAIPLGEPRLPSNVKPFAVTIAGPPRPVTVTTSVPPSPRKRRGGGGAVGVRPNVAVVEMRSEKREPPVLSVQVLPNVDIESVVSSSSSSSPAQRDTFPGPPARTLPTAEGAPQPPDLSEREDGFPGTSFINVTDLPQGIEAEEEFSDGPIIELNGYAESDLDSTGAPSFPYRAPDPVAPRVDVELKLRQRDPTQGQLLIWVEQELMARVVSELLPRLQRQQQEEASESESEEGRPYGSDIAVEAAGGGGLQLFVDAGLPVDSDLVRALVAESLAEVVAITLGQRPDARPARPAARSPPRARSPINLENYLQPRMVPTPLPTPQHTPPRVPSPDGGADAPRVRTPVPTPRTSLSEEEEESEGIPTGPELAQAAEDSLPVVIVAIATPAPSPSPPVSARAPTPEPPPTANPWGDAELPLEEENPSPRPKESPRRPPVHRVMSVQREEEPTSLVGPPVPSPVPVTRSPTPPPPPPSPSLSPRSPLPRENTPSSSLISITETETGDRNFSDGEILVSYNRILAAQALAEEGVTLVNGVPNLSNTLHDVQDMDFDPPSEGQVVRQPPWGAHRDPVLSMMVSTKQKPVEGFPIHYRPEDEGSVGELSEGQRPKLTSVAETVMTGHSRY
uniref:Uncharacterized protein n=1 Tax=Petromyzon marinus TaxID=7757 RepID=S4RN98_PETMA